MKATVIWPEILTESNYEYPYPTDNLREMAVAEGLEGWALCLAGNKPPENFGVGMVKIGKVIGELATMENLDRLAEEILNKSIEQRT